MREQNVAGWNRQGVEECRKRRAELRTTSNSDGPARLAKQRGKRALRAKDACDLIHDGLILPLLVMDAFLAITDGARDFKAGALGLPHLTMNVRLPGSLQNQRSGLVARSHN